MVAKSAEGLDGSPSHKGASPAGTGRLALLALGVIYGDIGTSPLYAIRECFSSQYGIAVTHQNVLGILSLVFWTLVLLVTVKYHMYVIRADNRGEGGILALTSLVQSILGGRRVLKVLVPMGLFGGALLYGDGALTPAISVLSAVEGLDVATPVFGRFVVPITVVILIGLFLLQKRGTGGIGALFGPVMLVWFSALAVLGMVGIAGHPSVLAALNPLHAVHFLANGGMPGYLVLGAVFLVATGGETLYADLGHFSEKSIQIDWFSLVGPALVLNYFGQGALILSHPEAASNPFYLLAPQWALYPLVILATAATIIASQAVITGVFSLTMQAVQLGFMPRTKVEHTSASQMGQIYIPSVNWILMVATIGLVVGFRSSSALAGAYGIAIAATMAITTTLAFPVAWKKWGWPIPVALGVTLVFLAIDFAFLGANFVKIGQGGWFPLGSAALVFLLMTTWKSGRKLLGERVRARFLPMPSFVEDVRAHPPVRLKGDAVCMTGNIDSVPMALLHSYGHLRALHERLVFLTVLTDPAPYVSVERRIAYTGYGLGFHRVVAHYGFMEEPNVPELFAAMKKVGLALKVGQTTFIVGHETLLVSRQHGMARWRKRLFAFLSRNAQPVTAYFQIPANRVIEVGAQVEL